VEILILAETLLYDSGVHKFLSNGDATYCTTVRGDILRNVILSGYVTFRGVVLPKKVWERTQK